MKVINLYGAPSAGKSTAMLGITFKMKLMGLSVENTPEFFKEMIYEQSQADLFGGQLYVLGEQNRRIARLKDKNDFAITDCPLPLIGYYTPSDYINGFQGFLANLYDIYENYNYFIIRKHSFENEKRAHDETQSNKIEQELPKYLEKLGIKTIVLESGEDLSDRIIEDMINRGIISTEQLRNARNQKCHKIASDVENGEKIKFKI